MRSWFDWIWSNIAPDARAKKGLHDAGAKPDRAARQALEERVLRTLPLDRIQEGVDRLASKDGAPVRIVVHPQA